MSSVRRLGMVVSVGGVLAALSASQFSYEAAALQTPGFSVPFRDLRGDCERIVERIDFLLDSDATDGQLPVALDVIEAGFFRDRYAFVVGRWVLTDSSFVPFVVALLNSETGIFVDLDERA